jgi:hypothetical protein
MGYSENKSYEQVAEIEDKHDDSNAQSSSEPNRNSAEKMQDEISDLRLKYSPSSDTDDSSSQGLTNDGESTAQNEHADLRSKYSQPEEAAGSAEPQMESEGSNLA